MHDIISTVLKNQFCSSAQSEATKPSSRAVAVWRAVHQLLEQPPVFIDPIALNILGDAHALTENLGIHKDPLSAAMRVSVAIRSRLAEDEREDALQAGAHQYVILGAGLDTYAYRTANAHERVFEVDLPTMQAAKIAKVQQLVMQPNCTLSYVACDFETQSLEEILAAAGFDKTQKAFFSWLGVVPYLDELAIENTLKFIKSCAPGSRLVFDYIVAPDNLSELEQLALQLLAAQLAKGGEPLKSLFDPQALAQKLACVGFSKVENIGPEYLNDRYLSQRSDGLRVGNVTRLFALTV